MIRGILQSIGTILSQFFPYFFLDKEIYKILIILLEFCY
jgi:hypothetical protein